VSDGVDFHSQIATEFAEQYAAEPEFRERRQVWTELIERLAVPEGRAVDVGCGAGTLTLVAARNSAHVVGIDGSLPMLELARQALEDGGADNVEFRQGRIEELDALGLEPADLVLCSSVLEYVENLDAALGHLADLTRPGGHLVISMPNALSPVRFLERVAYALIRRPAYLRFVHHRSSPADLARRLAPAGLRPVDSRFYAGRGGRLDRLLPERRRGLLFVSVFARPG
jgi:2-polyprenyl-6-hydroxyphenyl methylase/3-demethylubiquinone-9 3-methyltransferase